MGETTVKVTLTGMLAALSIWLELLTVPVLLLVAAMSIDYITGIRAAKYRGEQVNSAKGLKGLEKKVMLLLLVAVGLLIDLLMIYCVGAFGMDFPFKFAVALVITVWLTVNEIISILENIRDTGTNLPVWLLPLIKNIKSKVESAAPKPGEEDNNGTKTASSDK